VVKPTNNQWFGIWLFVGIFCFLWLMDPTPRCPGCFFGSRFWQRALITAAVLGVLALAHRLIGNMDDD
jgi:hypothetical protein